MTRKQRGSLVGAVALAAIAPVVTLALLHAVGGTAQAQAPPPTFWKVSMPDLGQHSDSWCWAAAAANSFWWYADNLPGQEGLLGGGGTPWKAIDPASTAPGSACGVGLSWYDSRDAPPPGGDGPAIPGYPTVLKKIAESTFKDANQDGNKQPAEQNYCYGEGVEKWDYLIGLRDYVKNYGSGLMVHDIIDPAKCGVGTGLIVNRTVPTMNSRNPCGPGQVVPGGVPGVYQTGLPGQPSFLDYQTELSRGQDVLLWMESGVTPETAHVVTGVGYNNAGGAFGLGTVTVSDPWTHTTNPPLPPAPSASHTDGLVAPWQSKPDHNTSPNHGALPATEPYNQCDVKQLVPFQIQCYNEDTGAPQVWSVVDVIFLSPIPVGGTAELPDTTGSTADGSNALVIVLTVAGIGAALTAGGGLYLRRRYSVRRR
jgi:hypothetical protein